jgi:hypothetical protein
VEGDAVGAGGVVQHQIGEPIEFQRRCERRETVQQILRFDAQLEGKLEALIQAWLIANWRIAYGLQRHFVPLVGVSTD